METVIDLKDLLKHEILDLYSVEEQIIEALPLMIEKAGNEKLKATLKEHLKITEEQKNRLDEIKQALSDEPAPEENAGDNAEAEKKPGFFSRLFGGSSEKCKGMEGLIAEGQKMMSADMSPEAADAAIIASAQKIEHYEISGYGTARAYARELKLDDVANKLEQTLNEEYMADDLLTQLAVGNINIEAERATGQGSQNGKQMSKASKASSNGRSGAGGGSSNKKAAAKKTSGAKKSSGAAKSGAKKSASKSGSKSASKSSGSKGSSSSNRGNSSKGGNSKSAAKSKAASKKSAAKSSAKGNSKSASKNKSSRRR